MQRQEPEDILHLFHPVTAEWFRTALGTPTAPQRMGWPAIARGESTLILAPTGTGKTLAAFLWCLDQLMLSGKASGQQISDFTQQDAMKVQHKPTPALSSGMRKLRSQEGAGCRILYVSPLKALAVDVERNLRVPLAGIAETARRRDVAFHRPEISVRTGDTPQKERARFRRHPAEILITTPESLYLLLTSEAAAALRTVETVIVDEIHALVPTKRGAHLALSLERLEAITKKPLQRIGLSATQRPLEEIARFLGGAGRPDGQPLISKGPQDVSLAVAASRRIDSPDFVPSQKQGGHRPVSDEIALSSAEDSSVPAFRPVTIVDASEPKKLVLRVEVPVEDMARPRQPKNPNEPKRDSIWNAIYPKLLKITRERRSTIIFVNNRRIAERIAAAMNDLAGEMMVRAHHGSLAASKRQEIEEQLKAGTIRALVATSTLELGIDMGAVDMVVQVEAPPSVASGMQRIGRAGHSVGAASEGVIVPKYRSDLVACAAVTRAMHEGLVEVTRYLRNPLDVLAQQLVAIVAQPPEPGSAAQQASGSAGLSVQAGTTPANGISVEEVYALVRGAAPFATLSREVFEGVLDMLAGRYPSDEFAELRPRITWDRERNILTPRQGAKSLAILNAGTIPDRGLYGVFLSKENGKPVRVGELDEEMVFESRIGDTFVLGASTWRIDEIRQDRVLVSPAPGEPGRTPFWHGDTAGRPLEFGKRIGRLVRELREMPRAAAMSRLVREHDLDPNAAENLLRFIADQETVTQQVPDDRTIIVERVRDEVGNWRMCVLTPFGARVHAPWAMAAAEKIGNAEIMWSDDGFVLRFPDMEEPPDAGVIVLDASEASELVLQQLGSTAMFAAKFRENAARALLLPKRRAQGRSPLWQQRQRAHGLLRVAAQYPSFPIILETYRECMRDVFDLPALQEILHDIEAGEVQVHVADTERPSPFASSLIFSYVMNFIYDGDAPLAERRAQALAINQEQLRDLLGDADLRELLDEQAIAEVEEQLQLLGKDHRVRSADGVHDLLLRLGDLSRKEIAQRLASQQLLSSLDDLLRAKRVLEVKIAGDTRLIAVEDAARYRDALGTVLPKGLPKQLLSKPGGGQDSNSAKELQPVLELVRRYARTHGPFTLEDIQQRFGIEQRRAEAALHLLLADGRVVEGGFRPAGSHREWCDAETLRLIRRKTLARLRKEVEPVEQAMLARFETHWQGVLQRRHGLDALLDTVEMLQGVPLPASILETQILPSRIEKYSPADLDTLIAAGEIVWRGVDSLGDRDGRIALYLADQMATMLPPVAAEVDHLGPREMAVLTELRRNGALFFAELHERAGGGYPGETLQALWNLVWSGQVTNDTFHALRAYTARPLEKRMPKRGHHEQGFRSRRTTPPSAQGRWSLLPSAAADVTEWAYAMTSQWLRRYGIVPRGTLKHECTLGSIASIYNILKMMEESGRIRRGYFAAGLGGSQFALPAAIEMLRSLRVRPPERAEMVSLAATDPANLYGAVLPWPDEAAPYFLSRSVGATVVLRNGELVAYLRRNNPNLLVFLPTEEPEHGKAARDLAAFLFAMAQTALQQDMEEKRGGKGLLISMINGQPAHQHPFVNFLQAAGFSAAPPGLFVRRTSTRPTH
ncbi:MAG: crosslink repair DNA glycosylase YcaQ family protein [Bacillota bacterium]|nr:crosslink repair DNA glycosylase YcaQ family protein [Bacillota bacterium]